MNTTTEQPPTTTPISEPMQASAKPQTPAFIKFIRIFLLVLIVIGIGLLLTQGLWVPKLVAVILNPSNTSSSIVSSNGQVQQTAKAFSWLPITATSSPGYTLVVQDGKVYAADPFSDPSNPQNVLISSSSDKFSLAESPQGKFGFYAKDATNVYAFVYYSGLHIIPVSGADPQTFTVVAPGIGVDKNDSWEASNKLPFMLDSSSFAILGNNTYRDKNHTYLIGDGITTGYEILDASPPPISSNIQVPWIPLAAASPSLVFFEKGAKVYVKDPNNSQLGYEEINGADFATFRVLDASVAGEALADTYAKDKSHVYYRTRIDGSVSPMPLADPTTFVAIQGNSAYDAQDKNHKYYLGVALCEDSSHQTCGQSDIWDNGIRWFQK